jgi:hypothetical protein
VDASAYALVELLLVFGVVVGFIHWQLHGLKKRALLRAQGKLPDEKAPRTPPESAPPPQNT